MKNSVVQRGRRITIFRGRSLVALIRKIDSDKQSVIFLLCFIRRVMAEMGGRRRFPTSLTKNILTKFGDALHGIRHRPGKTLVGFLGGYSLIFTGL